MKSIFKEDVHQEILQRINALDENSAPSWGKMNVAQMLWHCQAPLNIILGKENYGLKPNFLLKLLFKKSFYNDKPWRKGLPTAKFLKTTEEKDFKKEKQVLINLIDELYLHKDRKEWSPHPAFGVFTAEQWGKLQYKHLNHHLEQFNV